MASTVRLGRGTLVLIMMITMIALQFTFPSEAMVVWPPLLIVMIAKRLYQEEIRSYDWKSLKSGSFWEATFIALTQGIIAQAAGIVIVMYGFSIAPPPVSFGVTPFIAVSSVLLSPILEELVFRKIIFSSLIRYTGFWPAAAISSVMFAIAHYNYSASLGYFLLGMVWCRMYNKTQNLGVVMVAHIIFNALSMMMMMVRG